jgi:DNA repair photolyase
MDEVVARSIFSPATGFIRRGGFDWTCNPYIGCTFGCTYCYAMFLPQNRRPKEEWGRWFTAKKNAVELAARKARKLTGQALYMSSVTDPYQPVERSLLLTRGILEALISAQPRLLVQTRGPIVVRDIDVLQKFRSVRVNMSIPTDCDAVCQAFEPKAPPLEKRWQALQALRDAGVPVGICVTPILPLRDPSAFAERIIRFRPDVMVLQDFHDSQGGFGADTGATARELLKTNLAEQGAAALRLHLSGRLNYYESEAGFFPPPIAERLLPEACAAVSLRSRE